jgi:hypothetical protein
MSSTGVRVEYDSQRKLRDRNTRVYRAAHWPIWISVFFLVPGPLTFRLFAHGFDAAMALWLGVVVLGTGIAMVRGRLPGCEPRPYIIRFTEDRPNPLYRRICYTVAWSELIAYASLNFAGLLGAAVYGVWRMEQIYRYGYAPVVALVWVLGGLGMLPRVKASTKGEGHERRYFYGLVWATPVAQAVVMVLWKALRINPLTNWIKLAAFVVSLAFMAMLAVRGVLPRTRRILPGELAISD